MSFKTIMKTTEKFVLDNSPGILTGLGVAGAVTTAILAGKAGYSSALLLENVDPDGFLDRKEKIEKTWKLYIPAASVGVVTIVAVISANHIGSRRAAALAAAFKLSEELSQEYKERVVKTLGLQKEEKMRMEHATEKMAANPPDANMIIVTGSDVLMFDALSGRYFQGQIETVRKAVNDINYEVNNYHHASLSDFYTKIGLPSTDFSEEFGWNTDELLDVQFTGTIYDDKPAIMITYNKTPIRGFDRIQ